MVRQGTSKAETEFIFSWTSTAEQKPTLGVVCFPNEYPLGEAKFSLTAGYLLQTTSG